MKTYAMRNQRGAVLLVSLVLLLLITAIAISMVSNSTFQTAMVVNAQQRESVFRSAESAAEQSSTPELAGQLDVNAAGNYLDVPATDLHAPSADVGVTARLVYIGQGPALGSNSLGYGGSGMSGGPGVQIIEAQGSAASSGDKVATKVVQGLGWITILPNDSTYGP